MGDVAVGARSGRDEGEERPDDAVKREADEKEGEEDAARPQRSFWKELPLLVGIALLLALLIKTFLVQAFSIPSESMQDTLQKGDRVLVDKQTPWFGADPERGEVVVFHDPARRLVG
ncbi:signal peptidase I, partial [Streptomyces goshikiensis]